MSTITVELRNTQIDAAIKTPHIDSDVKDVIEVFQNPDYEALSNKPKIESVELSGNKTLEDIGVLPLSNSEIQDLINIFV